jgi:hypothetical protein
MLLGSKLLHRGQTIDRDGKITGPLPETTRLWFHAKAFHNLFLEAGDIGKDEWLCKQIPEETIDRYQAEKQLAQFVHAQPYVSPLFANELELDPRSIAARRYELPANMLPADTDQLTLGCDVGQRECWYLFLARRRDEGDNIYWHVPCYGKVDVPSDRMPLDDAIRSALREIHRIARAGFVVENSSIVRKPDQEWYDSRHKGDAVLKLIHDINKQEFSTLTTSQQKYQPVVGAYGCGSTMIQSARFNLPKKTGNEVRDIDHVSGLWYTSRIAANKTYAVFWDADTSKREVQHVLTLRDYIIGQDDQTPGSLTLYTGTARTHERFARHVTNEQLRRDSVTGKLKWHRNGANHLLDCLAMAWRAHGRADHTAEKLGVYKPLTVLQPKTQEPHPRTKAKSSAPTQISELPPLPTTKPAKPTGQNWYDRS